MIGGALLLDGIRSMFGHHPGGAAFGNLADDRTSPWASGGSAANSDLARQAEIDHVGDHVHDTNDQLSQADALSDADDDEDDMSDDDTDFADSATPAATASTCSGAAGIVLPGVFATAAASGVSSTLTRVTTGLDPVVHTAEARHGLPGRARQ